MKKKGNIENKAKLMLVLSMLIFGTIGIFRRSISLPSSTIALSRGFTGMLFLLFIVRFQGKKLSLEAFKGKLTFLCLSGILLGFNWILLFEAYQYTSVATATLCYYMAPIFVILISPVVLKEQLTLQKTACVLTALTGMLLVSGVLQTGISQLSEMKGIFLSLGAAVLYTGIILVNQKLKTVPAYDKTIIQLGISALVLLPYTLITEPLTHIVLTPAVIALLILIGIVHTGLAYALYFGSMEHLKAQTVALFSYIDPVAAIVLSALFLGEKMSIAEIAGAVMVLGSTIFSELTDRKS